MAASRSARWEQERWALAARGFSLNGLCFQGRDATDQHIVDVALKMLQGEGSNPSSQSVRAHRRPLTPSRSLHVFTCLKIWSPGGSFQPSLRRASGP